MITIAGGILLAYFIWMVGGAVIYTIYLMATTSNTYTPAANDTTIPKHEYYSDFEKSIDAQNDIR